LVAILSQGISLLSIENQIVELDFRAIVAQRGFKIVNRQSKIAIMDRLPIDPYLPQITALLQKENSLVLMAPPGAGKTTRVPCALLNAGFADSGEILVLEPRRIAARLAAARVAQELGEKPGETIGYSIRYENVSGPRTRIRYLTEAILSRRMIQDPDLDDVSAVILDEFHERSIATDLALALLKPLQERKPGIKVVVMSATLKADPVAAFLGANRITVAGTLYDLEIEHETKSSDLPLHRKVYSAVLKLLNSGISGDILVFLPGSSEIRQSMEALAPLKEKSGILVYPLHGDLSSTEQIRAISPASSTKVILATNVAETSITIPGIAAVVDSGLARVAGHSAWSGLPTLTTAKISKSAAVQRAGRAGRTQAGRVLRLYTRPDFETRPEHEIPEIRRADLAETVLMLHGAGIQDVHFFTWFDPPPKAAIEAAESILLGLGAINREGNITAAGYQMLRLPVHPRLARLVLEGEKLNVLDESSLLAALLSERDIRLNFRSNFGFPKSKTESQISGQSDLVNLLDCFRMAEQAHFDRKHLQTLDLDSGAVYAVKRAHRHLQRLLRTRKPATNQPQGSGQTEEALMIAALAAFPDRVAKRRKAGGHEFLLAEGGMAVLSRDSIVHQSEFIIAVDAEEKRGNTSSKSQTAFVRLASAIEIEWLAELFPEAIVQKSELIWNEKAARVDEVRKTTYRQITLEEMVRPASRLPEAAQILASAVLSKDLSPIRDCENLSAVRARLSLLARHFPEENLPGLEKSSVHQMVKRLCENKISMAELSSLSLVNEFMDTLSDRQRSLLAREAPERIRLNRGRMVKVHYELSKPPWIESRLQDFFGMQSTPVVCGGKAPLTLHLLAPNGRAVQVTQDLAGFWERHYPGIRKELMRRYPKHSWPEWK
jgi:ATP-dependent helicase HrpB